MRPTGATAVLLLAATATTMVSGASQQPTECADNSMTLWMRNSAGKTPCQLVQDVLRVCDSSFEIGFLPRSYTCNNGPGSALAPCCCGSPTFALMSACWSCQYNVTFDLVTTTFTAFEKDCQALPNPITTYDPSVRTSIDALALPAWAEMEPLAGKWDMSSAWKNSTPDTTSSMPVPTGYPYQVTSTGISKGALAGAIVGAILGSKILFMLAGYFFWRWWRKQPNHRHHDDDEKGYARQIVGEPRYHFRGRFSRRHQRGSRGEVDLDEDTTSPRSSRWLNIPPYLHPTSFHSHSSGSNSPAPAPAQQVPDIEPGDVTPFQTDNRPPESEKARTRRMSGSLRVTNDHHPELHEAGNIPAPLPALLARARTLSGDVTPPNSPSLNSPLMIHSGSSPLLASQGRSNSHSLSTGTGTDSSGAMRRYQEDDAGVSLVIEDGRGGSPSSGSGGGNGGGGGIRSVPPAYVDYRQGYSQADKAPRFESAPASVDGGGTSESATYVGSGSSHNHTRAGSVKGVVGMSKNEDDESGGSPTTVAPSVQQAPLGNGSGVPVPTTEVPPVPVTEHASAPATENPSTPATVPEEDARDRTTSGDSEGAATIKPDIDPSPPPKPIERSSTTDLANITAANTAANRSSSPATPATMPVLNPMGGRPGTSGSSSGLPGSSGGRPGTSGSTGGGRAASRERSKGGASSGERSGTSGSTGGGRAASSGSGGRPDTSGSIGGRPGTSGSGQLTSGGGSGSAKSPVRQTSAEFESQPEPTPAQPAESSWTWSRTLGLFGIALPGAAPPPPPKD